MAMFLPLDTAGVAGDGCYSSPLEARSLVGLSGDVSSQLDACSVVESAVSYCVSALRGTTSMDVRACCECDVYDVHAGDLGYGMSGRMHVSTCVRTLRCDCGLGHVVTCTSTQGDDGGRVHVLTCTRTQDDGHGVAYEVTCAHMQRDVQGHQGKTDDGMVAHAEASESMTGVSGDLVGYDEATKSLKLTYRFWFVAEQVAPSASEEDLIKEDSLGGRSQGSFSSQAARDMEELGKIRGKKIESPEHINDDAGDLRGPMMQEGLEASVKKCFEDAALRVDPDARDLPGQSECREGIGSDDAAPHVGPDARDLPGRDECREAALVVEEDQNRAPEKRAEEDGCPEEDQNRAPEQRVDEDGCQMKRSD